MKFYVRAYSEPINENFQYPCLMLIQNNWDDYGFKTSFELQYYPDRKSRNIVGTVKIMDLRKDEVGGLTILEKTFTELNDNYCSLGISTDYYKSLYQLSGTINILNILDALNDAAYMPGIKEKFENTNGFATSLLREREAKSSLMLGESIINGIPIDSELKFTFSTKLKNADFAHSVSIKFNRNSELRERIFAIVGKNGTGKTMFLSNLANALSFTRQNNKVKIEEYETGSFDTSLGPPFGKVIAVSYSMFDTFKRPKPSKRFSYIYCGIRNDDGEIDIKLLQKRHIESLFKINKKQHVGIWANTLRKFFNFNTLKYKIDDYDMEITNIRELETNHVIEQSSGHSMLIFTLTELIANLSDNSLVLFDEPENHLHPNAIANLINTINELVVKFNSFAIITTHSPIVVQEIPSRNVCIFERENNTPITRPLDIESYGENLTVITKHIFETNEVKEGYKAFLKELSESMTFEMVNSLFENRLSLNAKIFLSSLYS